MNIEPLTPQPKSTPPEDTVTQASTADTETPKVVADAITTNNPEPPSEVTPSSPTPSTPSSIYPSPGVRPASSDTSTSPSGAPLEDLSDLTNNSTAKLAAGTGAFSVVASALAGLMIKNPYGAMATALLIGIGVVVMSAKSMGSRSRPNPWALAGFVFGIFIIAGALFVGTYYIYFKIRLSQLRSSYPSF